MEMKVEMEIKESTKSSISSILSLNNQTVSKGKENKPEEIIQFDNDEEFIPFILDSEDEMRMKSKKTIGTGTGTASSFTSTPTNLSNTNSNNNNNNNNKKDTKKKRTNDFDSKGSKHFKNEKDDNNNNNNGSSSSKIRNNGGNNQVSLLKFNMPWMGKDGLCWKDPGSVRLHYEIIEFVNWISPTEEERNARSGAIDRLKKVIYGLWPTSLVEVFGSYHTDLYLPSSDIDIVIQMKNGGRESNCMYHDSPLRKLARAIKNASIAILGSIQVISRARVPIIKYRDRKTGVEIDASFNTVSGVESAAIMKEWGKKYPAMRPLVLVLKSFLAQRQLNKVFSGGLGSYSLMCMVVSLLQTHPLIQTGLIRAHENLGMILLDFLELYGRNFNYEEVGISLISFNSFAKSHYQYGSDDDDEHDNSNGNSNTKKSKNNNASSISKTKGKEGKEEMEGGGYFSKYEREWWNEQRPFLLSIQDPQNPSSDVARSSYNFQSTRMAFEHAFDMLKASLLHVHRMITKGSRINNNASILGNILQIEEAILEQRSFIKKNI